MKKINVYILDEVDEIIKEYQKNTPTLFGKPMIKDDAVNQIILKFKKYKDSDKK